MSSNMHDTMKVGDTVLLGAPCGVFTRKTVVGDKNVLISAGIGITAMKALFDSMEPSQVVKAFHVEKNANRHAFLKHFEESGIDCEFHYTATGGRPDFGKVATALVAQAGVDASYLLCAPPTFIYEMKQALVAAGATKVQFEKFGTGPVAPAKPVVGLA
jgi:nitric oxide dioxygenase